MIYFLSLSDYQPFVGPQQGFSCWPLVLWAQGDYILLRSKRKFKIFHPRMERYEIKLCRARCTASLWVGYCIRVSAVGWRRSSADGLAGLQAQVCCSSSESPATWGGCARSPPPPSWDGESAAVLLRPRLHGAEVSAQPFLTRRSSLKCQNAGASARSTRWASETRWSTKGKWGGGGGEG